MDDIGGERLVDRQVGFAARIQGRKAMVVGELVVKALILNDPSAASSVICYGNDILFGYGEVGDPGKRSRVFLRDFA